MEPPPKRKHQHVPAENLPGWWYRTKHPRPATPPPCPVSLASSARTVQQAGPRTPDDLQGRTNQATKYVPWCQRGQHPWTGQKPTPPHRGWNRDQNPSEEAEPASTDNTHPPKRPRASKSNVRRTNDKPHRTGHEQGRHTFLTGDRPYGRHGPPLAPRPRTGTHPCDAQPQHSRTEGQP